MGKGGAILGVIALILGGSALGFSVITWMGQGDQGKTEFWYDHKQIEYIPTAVVYIDVPDLYVIVNLDAAATLHLLFITSTRVLPNPVSFADMFFYFAIDGVRLLNPYTRAGPYEGDATYQYYPVALQHSEIFSAGTYNISIVVFSETTGNLMRQSSIAVTRY